MIEPGAEPYPLNGHLKIQIFIKMDIYNDEALVIKLEELEVIEDFDYECESCKIPVLIHAGI